MRRSAALIKLLIPAIGAAIRLLAREKDANHIPDARAESEDPKDEGQVGGRCGASCLANIPAAGHHDAANQIKAVPLPAPSERRRWWAGCEGWIVGGHYALRVSAAYHWPNGVRIE